jgi:hypothetical protein
MKILSANPRDVAAQLRYHYFCCRQIERTIHALERIQAMRKNRTWSEAAVRRCAEKAA